jgi:hypothetical protein
VGWGGGRAFTIVIGGLFTLLRQFERWKFVRTWS